MNYSILIFTIIISLLVSYCAYTAFFKKSKLPEGIIEESGSDNFRAGIEDEEILN